MLLSQSLCTVFHYQSFTSFTWKPSPSSNISTIIFQPLIVIKLSYRCTKLTGIKAKWFYLSLSACSFHHWLPEFTYLLSEALTTPNTVIMQTIHLFYVLFNSKNDFLYLHVQYALWQKMTGFTWRSCIPWKNLWHSLVQTGLDPGVYYTSGKDMMHSVKQGSLSYFMKNKNWAVSSFELGRTDYTFTFSNCAEIVALLCMLIKFLYNAWAEMVRPYI